MRVVHSELAKNQVDFCVGVEEVVREKLRFSVAENRAILSDL